MAVAQKYFQKAGVEHKVLHKITCLHEVQHLPLAMLLFAVLVPFIRYNYYVLPSHAPMLLTVPPLTQ